jgi:EPS-associated MarR family transcriptional regulator
LTARVQNHYVHGVNNVSPTAADSLALDTIRLLEERPELSQRELAKSLGVSLGRANYCIRALVAKGIVKVQNYRTSRNKMAYLYILTPMGVQAKGQLAREFLQIKMQEYDALRVEIARLKRDSMETGREL